MKRMEGFQKRLSDPSKAKEVRVARISYTEDGHGAVCSCGGWAYWHRRTKVMEDAIDKHLLRKHGGRGFRL